MAGYIFKITKGASMTRTVYRRDKITKLPLDLTGWTVKDCKILKSVELESLAVDVTATIDADQTTGKIHLSLTLAQVEALPVSKTMGIYLNITHPTYGTALILSCPVWVYAKGESSE